MLNDIKKAFFSLFSKTCQLPISSIPPCWPEYLRLWSFLIITVLCCFNVEQISFMHWLTLSAFRRMRKQRGRQRKRHHVQTVKTLTQTPFPEVLSIWHLSTTQTKKKMTTMQKNLLEKVSPILREVNTLLKPVLFSENSSQSACLFVSVEFFPCLDPKDGIISFKPEIKCNFCVWACLFIMYVLSWFSIHIVCVVCSWLKNCIKIKTSEQ